MIPTTIVWVILGWLSFAPAEIAPSLVTTNLAEFKQTVVANELALEKAITEYGALGFQNVSKLAERQLERGYYAEKFMEIPTNLTVDDLSDDQYEAYQMMIPHSIKNSIYSNAARLTDLLKTEALYIAVMKSNSVSKDDYKYVRPLKGTVDLVFKVIQEEKDVLVNGRFVKPNSELDSLYWMLRRFSFSTFYFYWPYTAEDLYEKCALPSTGCGIELRGAIHNRMVLNEKAEICSPIDSKLKVHKLVTILSDSREADKEMFDALEAANLNCLLRMTRDPCNKRSDY